MREKNQTKLTDKHNLHPRNKHRSGYDFNALIESCPGLKPFIILNEHQNQSINFADPTSVKMLNKALLVHFYGVSTWDVPDGYLCPPVPGRADYLHYVADLLAETNGGVIPNKIEVLDVGTGANLIYPIIGNYAYGWNFVGSEIDHAAVKWARQLIAGNKRLQPVVDVRWQPKPEHILNGIIKPDEWFDVTICNPPFHASAREAEQGTRRKLDNLGRQLRNEPVLNFGGKNNELWYPGGEQDFIRRMVEQSVVFAKQCLWFSTLVSKKDNLPGVYHHLRRAGVSDVRTINMSQGQKISRVVAWTFLSKEEQTDWTLKRWQ